MCRTEMQKGRRNEKAREVFPGFFMGDLGLSENLFNHDRGGDE